MGNRSPASQGEFSDALPFHFGFKCFPGRHQMNAENVNRGGDAAPAAAAPMEYAR